MVRSRVDIDESRFALIFREHLASLKIAKL